MHVLRSTYLPAYTSMIHPPYTSDPFPFTSPSPSTYSLSSSASQLTSPVNSVQRETAVLDQFISIKVREDVWVDDSELHLEREELFKDLFDLMQPRARLEDLVRAYALDAGVVSVSSSANAVVATYCGAPSSSSSSRTGNTCAPNITLSRVPPYSSTSSPASRKTAKPITRKVPFNSLSCSFSPRSAGIIYSSKNSKRTIVEVARSREEKLEVAAKRLVRELVTWVEENYR